MTDHAYLLPQDDPLCRVVDQDRRLSAGVDALLPLLRSGETLTICRDGQPLAVLMEIGEYQALKEAAHG